MDRRGITIEDDVLIGPKVNLVTISHPLDPGKRRSTYCAPIVIKRGAWLGAAVSVMPGVTIGENAVVAANAVVTRDVLDNVVVAGVPARVIDHIDHIDLARLNLHLRPSRRARPSTPSGRTLSRGAADMESMRTCSLLNRTGRLRTGVALLGLALTMAAGAAGDRLAAGNPRPAQTSTATQERPTMWMTVGDAKRYAVTLEDNPTARAFVQLLPLTLDMPDLNGNEKHIRLPRILPTNAVQPGTIQAGDVMLYGSDTLVVFYKTFPSSHRYTRIGRVANSAGLTQALGSGTQRIDFTLPAYFSPSWTAFQADRGRYFSVIVDGVSD